MDDNKVAILNKVLWLETIIKKINHDKAPKWVKEKCQDALDNIVSIKVLLQN
jgi:hypothetical protein